MEQKKDKQKEVTKKETVTKKAEVNTKTNAQNQSQNKQIFLKNKKQIRNKIRFLIFCSKKQEFSTKIKHI